MTGSKIEWTDRSDWNPIRGCTRVSPGCGGPGPHGGCYAEAIAGRFSDPGQAFHGFAERTSKGGRWTGKVELIEDRLALPLRWKKSARVFASSTSDVFHEALPDEAIDRIFAVMALCPHLTFQVLTKRSARMREYMVSRQKLGGNVGGQAVEIMLQHTSERSGAVLTTRPADAARVRDEVIAQLYSGLPNVMLGVSVEDQQRADERIPDLLATPAAVRFISAEPLLGPLDLGHVPWPTGWDRGVDDISDGIDPLRFNRAHLDWVIVGGESGPNARPMHPDWARSLRDQCAAGGVAFHFKQHGEYLDFNHLGDRWNSMSDAARGRQQFVEGKTMIWVGKKRAGRLLDGVEHNGFPDRQRNIDARAVGGEGVL